MLATSLVADLQLIAAAIVWGIADHVLVQRRGARTAAQAVAVLQAQPQGVCRSVIAPRTGLEPVHGRCHDVDAHCARQQTGGLLHLREHERQVLER